MRKKKVNIQEFIAKGGNINELGFEIIDEGQRKNTARVIFENNPDVICL